jgi:hypothetical protein
MATICELFNYLSLFNLFCLIIFMSKCIYSTLEKSPSFYIMHTFHQISSNFRKKEMAKAQFNIIMYG